MEGSERWTELLPQVSRKAHLRWVRYHLSHAAAAWNLENRLEIRVIEKHMLEIFKLKFEKQLQKQHGTNTCILYENSKFLKGVVYSFEEIDVQSYIPGEDLFSSFLYTKICWRKWLELKKLPTVVSGDSWTYPYQPTAMGDLQAQGYIVVGVHPIVTLSSPARSRTFRCT